MADIDRLIPTTVGVLDAHDQFRRFSMHVGADVTASFSQAEAGTKSQTNISGGGYRGGERVSISASLKGRIWSGAAAQNLKHWRDWCDSVGDKLLDDTITIEKVIGQFILPETLTGRPAGVLLAVEWPWIVHMRRQKACDCPTAGRCTRRHTPTSCPTPARAATLQVRRQDRRLGGRPTRQPSRKAASATAARAGRSQRRPAPFRAAAERMAERRTGCMFVLDGDRIIDGDS